MYTEQSREPGGCVGEFRQERPLGAAHLARRASRSGLRRVIWRPFMSMKWEA